MATQEEELVEGEDRIQFGSVKHEAQHVCEGVFRQLDVDCDTRGGSWAQIGIQESSTCM